VRRESFYSAQKSLMAPRLIPAGLAALTLLLSSCGGTPHMIVLKDGRGLATADTPRFVAKTGYYRYRGLNGKDALVQRDEVLLIQER
jgi:Bacterial protein of unknown function (DUF903)